MKLLIVDNTKWTSWGAKTEELKNWFAPLVALDIEIQKTNFTDIPFQNYLSPHLRGVDKEWYDKNVSIRAIQHDIVLFVVDLMDWKGEWARGWRGDKTFGAIELQIGCGEYENVILPNSQDLFGSFFNYARHEICHALYMISGQPDRTHELYDSNRMNEILNDLKLPEPKNPYEEKQSLIQRLLFIIAELRKQLFQMKPEIEQPPIEPRKPLLDEWCLAIQQHEGWFEGSRSFRNKNPGNLRYVGQRLAIGKDIQNFCIFKTYEDGYATLKTMLLNAATGKSKIYTPTMTLSQFFHKFAPSFDNNIPERYADFVATKLKVPITWLIKDLV